MPARQGEGFPGRAGKLGEEAVEVGGVEFDAFRQLPEDGAERGSEGQHSRREEIRERRSHTVQPSMCVT